MLDRVTPTVIPLQMLYPFSKLTLAVIATATIQIFFQEQDLQHDPVTRSLMLTFQLVTS